MTNTLQNLLSDEASPAHSFIKQNTTGLNETVMLSKVQLNCAKCNFDDF